MKESYIKLLNITVSKLQDVVDYLDENNIEYIEDYKEEVELNKYKIVLDKIKEKCDLNKVEYIDKDGNEIASSIINKNDILKLLEEIE